MRIVLFVGLLTLSAPALGLEPTGCRFSKHVATSEGNVAAVAVAMTHLAEAARARTRDDLEQEREEAARAARAISDANPRLVEIILDIAVRLNPEVLSSQAFDHLNGVLIARLEPVRDQIAEMDVDPTSAYLKAFRRFHTPTGNRLDRLDGFRARISRQDICPERRFFLLLELARHIGEEYSQPLARTQIEVLRRDVDKLAGISRWDLPIRWYALMRLTQIAVDLEAFEWAESWLADTVAEARALEAAGASAAVLEEVRHVMDGLPEYVADQHDMFRRGRGGAD